MKKLLFVGVLIAILFVSINLDGMHISDEAKSKNTIAPSQTYTSHAPMVINSNDDFAGEGWSGDGSQGNPYLIEWLEFTSEIDGACISISHTTAWFRIMNCSFSPTTFAAAINLQDVSNGEILFSVTSESAWSIIATQSSAIQLGHLTLFETCVVMENSWRCSVSCCKIDYAPGDGVFFNNCSQSTVEGCEISNCAACGISVANTGESALFGNIISDNSMEQIYISETSTGNWIYDNEIHLDMLWRVRDDGHTNYWDDSISIGNWWSDYDESGLYYIPGLAGSIDHFPRGPSSAPTTTNIPSDSGRVLITTWKSMDLSLRAALCLLIGVLYGAIVIIMIKRLR